MVPAEAIGDTGRDVRCKKCAHTWFQQSEKESLDALISRIQSSDIVEDDISFDDLKSLGRPKKVEPAGIMARLKALFVKNHSLSKESSPVLKYVASGMVALAVVSVLLWGACVERLKVASAIPSLAPVFADMGFRMSPYEMVNPEEALIVEKVELVADKNGQNIKGNLINLTSGEIKLPRIGVTYLDAKGESINQNTYKLALVSLKKEANISFSLPVPAPLSPEVASVEIRFVD